jgi:uncharacterized protein RhaS with RHS repeats
VRIGWPSTAVRSYMEKLGAEGEGDWLGSVLTDQRDPSGFLYRRNRYYDPMAGRFTQPDPIGLAGGINLYGFAAGDPVSRIRLGIRPMSLAGPGVVTTGRNGKVSNLISAIAQCAFLTKSVTWT